MRQSMPFVDEADGAVVHKVEFLLQFLRLDAGEVRDEMLRPVNPGIRQERGEGRRRIGPLIQNLEIVCDLLTVRIEHRGDEVIDFVREEAYPGLELKARRPMKDRIAGSSGERGGGGELCPWYRG